MTDATDELRSAAQEVARRARSVRIDRAAVGPYARALDLTLVAGDVEDTPPASTRARDERAAYWLSLDAINFGSGWFPSLRKDVGRPATERSQRRGGDCEREGTPSAAELVALDPGTVAAILDQDPGHELMELFALSLNDLGTRLLGECGGEVLTLIDGAGGRRSRWPGGWAGGRASPIARVTKSCRCRSSSGLRSRRPTSDGPAWPRGATSPG